MLSFVILTMVGRQSAFLAILHKDGKAGERDLDGTLVEPFLHAAIEFPPHFPLFDQQGLDVRIYQ